MITENKILFNDILVTDVNNVSERSEFKGWNAKNRILDPCHHELIFIKKGTGKISISGITYKISKGHIVYIPPNVKFSCPYNAHNKTIHYIALNFSLCIVDHRKEEWVYCQNLKYSTKKNIPDSRFDKNRNWLLEEFNYPIEINSVTPIVNYEKISSMFEKVYEIHRGKIINYKFKQNMLLNEVLYEILNNNELQSDSPTNANRVRTAVDYISKNYNKQITLKEVSQILGVSIGYLIRLFNIYVGDTPINYLNKLRISISKDLLINTDYRIKDISEMLGINNEYYYSKLFKKFEGISPSYYRNKYK